MATRTISDSGGTRNWNDTATWTDSTVPLAGDDVVSTATSGNITVNVNTEILNSLNLSTYTATITINNICYLKVGGNVTLGAGMTSAMSGTGYLQGTASGTWTSNGHQWQTRVEMTGTAQTYTLADAWTISQRWQTAGSTSCTINGFSVTAAGGGQFNNTTQGTTTFTFTGGTLTCQAAMKCATTLAGDITFGTHPNNPSFQGTTFTYAFGTITQTGSNPQFRNCTLDTSGMTFLAIRIVGGNGTSETTTLNSILNATTLTFTNTDTDFAGPSGFTAGTLTKEAFNMRRTVKLLAGRTYTVTTNLNLPATAVGQGLNLQSTTTTDAILNLQVGASQTLQYVNATHIDSSGGQTIYSDGTITSCVNWSAPLSMNVNLVYRAKQSA